MENVIKKIQLPNGGGTYDIYDEGAARQEDLQGLASESYVNQKIADLINSAPETLDTLGEVAAAIAENEEVVEALNAAIGNKVDKVSGKQLSTNDFTTEEKQKLANIDENANAYVLPKATASSLGGVIPGANIVIANGVISIDENSVINALGYTPAEEIEIDTSLTISGAAADAKAVGDAFDALETVIALDNNVDGNIILRSYIQADEGEGGYTRLDSSLTVEGMAPDSKAVGDAINLRMLANAIIPITQGGTGAITAADALSNLGLTATATELNYCDGVTSNIQTQLNGKAASSHGTHVTYGTSASALGTSSAGSAATVSRSDHVHALPALTSCTGTLTVAKGGTGSTNGATGLRNLFAAGNTILSSYQYGTTLPTAGTVGRIFLKKVSS